MLGGRWGYVKEDASWDRRWEYEKDRKCRREARRSLVGYSYSWVMLARVGEGKSRRAFTIGLCGVARRAGGLGGAPRGARKRERAAVVPVGGQGGWKMGWRVWWREKGWQALKGDGCGWRGGRPGRAATPDYLAAWWGEPSVRSRAVVALWWGWRRSLAPLAVSFAADVVGSGSSSQSSCDTWEFLSGDWSLSKQRVYNFSRIHI